jgi:ketosteroid isomerase-like protein
VLDAALRERIRQGLAGFFAGDLDAVRALMADDIAAFDAPGMPDAGEYHGRDQLIARITEFRDLFEAIELREMTIEELAGGAFVVLHVHARSPATEMPVDIELGYVLTIRDGLVTELHSFIGEDQARAYADSL